jgi:hypothetical protein
MNAFVALGFVVVYLGSVLVAVSTSRATPTGRARALIASCIPYVVATAYAFVSPVPSSLQDVWRALSFALVYVILTAILVYTVKKQWAQSPD